MNDDPIPGSIIKRYGQDLIVNQLKQRFYEESKEVENREVQLILQLEDSFHDAWYSGDAKKIVMFFTEDGIRVGPDGVIQHGRKELEEAYDKLLNMMPGSTIKFEPGSIRILCDDFATWQSKLTIILAGDKPSLSGYSFDLLKKIDGRWLILETHPKMIAPIKV